MEVPQRARAYVGAGFWHCSPFVVEPPVSMWGGPWLYCSQMVWVRCSLHSSFPLHHALWSSRRHGEHAHEPLVHVHHHHSCRLHPQFLLLYLGACEYSPKVVPWIHVHGMMVHRRPLVAQSPSLRLLQGCGLTYGYGGVQGTTGGGEVAGPATHMPRVCHPRRRGAFVAVYLAMAPR